jgi:hypothetical protein
VDRNGDNSTRFSRRFERFPVDLCDTNGVIGKPILVDQSDPQPGIED